jgi:hypothetical protein
LNAAWAGVLIALGSGSWSLGAVLAAICVVLMMLRITAALLVGRAVSAAVVVEAAQSH